MQENNTGKQPKKLFKKKNTVKDFKNRKMERRTEIPKSSIKFYPEIAKTYKLIKSLPKEINDINPSFVDIIDHENSIFDEPSKKLLGNERSALTQHAYQIIKDTWETEKGRKFIEHLIMSFCMVEKDVRKQIQPKDGEEKIDAITKIIVYNSNEMKLLNKQMIDYLGTNDIISIEEFAKGINLDIENNLEWDVKKYFHVLMFFPIAYHSPYSDITLSCYSFLALTYFTIYYLDDSTRQSILLKAIKTRDKIRKQTNHGQTTRDGRHIFKGGGLSDENIEKLKKLKNQ